MNTPRLLKLTDVLKVTTLSKSSIYLYINSGKFPQPISLGARGVAWIESEINDWINERMESR